MPSGHTAREIIEVMLLRTSKAILDNDFTAMNACFALPLLLETKETELIITTEQEHREMFDRLVEGYVCKGVTDIIRVCEVAEFLEPNVIRSLHISHIMAGDQRVDDPLPTIATTELFDDGWRITAAQYAATTNVPVGRAMAVRANLPRGENV
ncbi:MAG: hypothetical protein AAFN63_11855 [Pseudomonadota bacterium]